MNDEQQGGLQDGLMSARKNKEFSAKHSRSRSRLGAEPLSHTFSGKVCVGSSGLSLTQRSLSLQSGMALE